MKLTWLILKVLIAIYNGQACQIGQEADFYSWVYAHPNYVVVKAFEMNVYGDYWLMSDDGEYYLFKFKEPIEQTIASGASHGECFRRVG